MCDCANREALLADNSRAVLASPLDPTRNFTLVPVPFRAVFSKMWTVLQSFGDQIISKISQQIVLVNRK